MKNGKIQKKHNILVKFYKPFGVLSQFSPDGTNRTLSEFGLPKDIYAAGRLDKDSEGLLLLTDDGQLNQKIAAPKKQTKKTYWVQIERVPSEDDLYRLRKGVIIKDGYKTLPCEVKIIDEPELPDRDPPIRFRKSVPTCWLEIGLREGKNRQVRRMTAAIGFPTLRLVRPKIGNITLEGLSPGQWKEIPIESFKI